MDGARALVEELRGAVGDERVLAAVAALPRERFVPAAQRARAYRNSALPIGCGQTISQPLVVARMLELLELRGTESVLDVGTGSGYHAALLALLARRVLSIERHPRLARRAAHTLRAMGIANVEVRIGDGTSAAVPGKRFEAINVAAAAGEAVPRALEEQLTVGGRLVAPVGGPEQHLVLVRRRADGFERRRFEPVRFVPLLGGEAPR